MRTLEYKEIKYKVSKESDEQYCLKDENFRERFKNYLIKQNLSGAIAFQDGYIKTSSYVGVIKFKNFQLDIFPKLLGKFEEEVNAQQFEIEEDNEETTKLSESECKSLSDKKVVEQITKNLIYMLSLTKKLDVKYSEHANINCCKNPFLEVLIRDYAQSLFECLKRLTPRNYVREEDNLNYLKGKLKFTENIRYNHINKAKFYCEYDEFSENNELNRLFLFVSKCLFQLSKNSKNKQILSFIMNYFCDMPLVKTDRYKAEKIILTRNQKLFEHPFKLAKMFLQNISVDISQNRIKNITLLWDMNKLFEEFTAEILKKGLTKYKIEYQKKQTLLKNPDTNRSKGNTYVDIYLEKKIQKNNDAEGNENKDKKIILDTKYKLSTLNNSDIYQVCTYCLLHDTDNSILIYPKEINKEIYINRIYVDVSNENLKDIVSSVKNQFENIIDIVECLHTIRPILKELKNNNKINKLLVEDNIIEAIKKLRNEDEKIKDEIKKLVEKNKEGKDEKIEQAKNAIKDTFEKLSDKIDKEKADEIRKFFKEEE